MQHMRESEAATGQHRAGQSHPPSWRISGVDPWQYQFQSQRRQSDQEDVIERQPALQEPQAREQCQQWSPRQMPAAISTIISAIA